jgi:two-component system chemotaxis sensor kinase CheA
MAVADVIDIFAIEGEVAPSLNPEIFEGIVHVDGRPIELLSSYSFFELQVDAVRTHAAQRPLCFISAEQEDGWEHRVLAPLLKASGYDVTFDAHHRTMASVILSLDANAETLASDRRLVKLRDSLRPSEDGQDSIYRYDRAALLSAVSAKVSGVA